MPRTLKLQLSKILDNQLGLSAFRPGLRILAFAFVLTLFQPPPLLVIVGERKELVTDHPKLGVHTRLTDEVEPWKIQRTMQLVREMGASWIVEFFPWAYYQGADGGFAWDHPDLVINHANAQGLNVIARLGLTPSWARPPDTPLNYLDEDGYDDFAEFAAAFAARYQGKVSYIIVWNEPNLHYEWGYQSREPADYVELLKIVHETVRLKNPGMGILAGALAPTLEPDGSPWGMSDLTYLDSLYRLGAAEYFDGLAVHAYGLTFPPDSSPGTDILNFRRVELIRDIMLKHEDSNRRIFITETGWNDHPRWTRAVSPGQRIQYTIDAMNIVENEWPYVQMAAIWAFRFPAPVQSYSDNFTLVTPEFIKKPIYSALKAWATGR